MKENGKLSDEEYEKEFVSKLKTYNKYLKINTEKPDYIKDIPLKLKEDYGLFDKAFRALEYTDEGLMPRYMLDYIYIKCCLNYIRFDFAQFVEDYTCRFAGPKSIRYVKGDSFNNETVLLVKEMYEEILRQERELEVIEDIIMPCNETNITIPGITGEYINVLDNCFFVRDEKSGEFDISFEKREEIEANYYGFYENYTRGIYTQEQKLLDALTNGLIKESDFRDCINRRYAMTYILKIIRDNLFNGNVYIDFSKFEKHFAKKYGTKQFYYDMEKIFRFIINLKLKKFENLNK